MPYSDKWYTPPEWLAWVRDELGEDYFDPCPAGWSEGDLDGLTVPWTCAPTYVNHPGGRGNPQKWWDRTMAECYWGAGEFSKLIWAAFNIEQLRYLKNGPLTRHGYLYLPKKRIAWVRAAGGKSSPTHWAGFWMNRKALTPPPVPCYVVKTPVEDTEEV